MDWEIIVIFIGLILSGIIIGYPLGHLFGKREAGRSLSRNCEPVIVAQCRHRIESTDILSAEILEEKR